MKLIIVFLATVLAVTLAAPVDDPKDAQIVSYESENIGIDGYKFSYETSDGVKRSEEGTIKNAGTENETLVITGTISWVGPDGVTYTIEFIADENGFQPKGEHLPK